MTRWAAGVGKILAIARQCGLAASLHHEAIAAGESGNPSALRLPPHRSDNLVGRDGFECLPEMTELQHQYLHIRVTHQL